MIPTWLMSASMLIYTYVLLSVHKRMQTSIKIAIILPIISLSFIYILFSLFEVELALRQDIGRIGFIALYAWHTVLLIVTKRSHIS
jgi:hypothetical protein